MSKIAVVYWSGTGNTEAMASAVAEGAKAAGGDVTLYAATDFSGSMVDGIDAIAFGCPAMGAEELEETEFAPMFQSCESALSGKKIALFATSGESDMGKSQEVLEPLAPAAEWVGSKRFEADASEEALRAWAEELGL